MSDCGSQRKLKPGLINREHFILVIMIIFVETGIGTEYTKGVKGEARVILASESTVTVPGGFSY